VNQWLFFRGAARQQWIDLPNTGVPSFTIFKLDVGFKFWAPTRAPSSLQRWGTLSRCDL